MKTLSCVTLLGLLVAVPACAGSIDPSAAAKAFAERQAICDRDHDRLWGIDLCGPMLFVDPRTRDIAANQAGADLHRSGPVFAGKLPANVSIANTALEWNGTNWSMVVWPLPDDRQKRDDLLAHESWHRIQNKLGLPAVSVVEDHLATLPGRITMRLEWRALAAALTAPNDAAEHKAIHDALLFRAWRWQQFPKAAKMEIALMRNEGLAEYTGTRLSGQSNAHLAARVLKAETAPSFVRSFAYTSGPALGYLLDRYRPHWRKALGGDADPGALLAEALHITLPADCAAAAKRAGARYGIAKIDAEENAAAAKHARQAKRWTALLVKGPVLHLPFKAMKIQFNPNNLFPLPPNGTVYPTLTVIDSWGKLTVTGGALIDANWSGVTVSAPAEAALHGKGWTLELNPGWQEVRDAAHAQDWTVVKRH